MKCERPYPPIIPTYLSTILRVESYVHQAQAGAGAVGVLGGGEEKADPADVRFCLKCGRELTAGETVCAGCGEKLPQGAAFCSKCGKKVE